MSAANHLEQIRSESQYPVYRGVIGVLTVLGYLGGVIMAGLGVMAMGNGATGAGIGSLIGAAITIFVIVPFYKEVSLMLVDAVDSTLERNSRS